MRAYQIMTPRVIKVGADTSIVEAAKIMLRHHISGLPVVDAAGRLIGIVSEGDFVRRAETQTEHKRCRWLTYLAGADRIAAEFAHERGRKVGDIMTPKPLTVTESTPLDQVVQIMESNSIKRVPVMRGNQMVGIITRSDFLAAVANISDSVAGPSVDDDRIRGEVTAVLQQAPWRPSRLNVTVHNAVVSLNGVVRKESARKAAIVAAENIAGVKKVQDFLGIAPAYPPPEEDLGGGDFVSLQEQPSTADDEPL